MGKLIQNSPLVSVLMTSYNREEFIAEAIESVLASGYKNFELLIVDDCSTDSTVAIAKDYQKKDGRVKVFVNEKNLTQFSNRNRAASYAKGQLLKYVDSDDIIYPHTLQTMVDGMNRFPGAALGYCLKYDLPAEKLPCVMEPREAFLQHFFEGAPMFVGPSGLIMKKEAFESVNGFEEFGMPSDNHLTLKIASRFPVVAMSKDLFLWRIHEGQIYSQNKLNYYNILNNYNYVRDILINYSPLSKEENKRLLFNYKKRFAYHICRLTLKFKWGMVYRILRDLKRWPKK